MHNGRTWPDQVRTAILFPPAQGSTASNGLFSDSDLILLIDGVGATSPGILRIQRALLVALQERAPERARIVFLQDETNGAVEETPMLQVIDVAPPRGLFGRWWWHHFQLPALIHELAPDVLYCLTGIVSQRVANATASIININNMAPFEPLYLRQFSRVSYAYWRLWLVKRLYLQSAARCDHLILHSRYALTVLNKGGVGLDNKTTVVLTGVPDTRGGMRTSPFEGRGRYLFYLSTIQRYKNHLHLIEAYDRALRQLPEIPPLLIAGYGHDQGYLRQIQDLIVAKSLGTQVEYLGIVKSEEKVAWLHHADINLFASYCETNSVVQAEILGCGGVMACANIEPMTEIAGEAAEFFDPHDVDDMARVIVELCQSETRRDQLRKLSIERAKELSWLDYADALWMASARVKDSFAQGS